MAIQTTVAPRQTWKLLIVAALCLVFAIWGAYDYWVRIPQRERDAARFVELQTQFNDFERRNAAMPLAQAELDRWAAVRDELDAFQGRVPEPPPKWDRPVQLWLYMIGCGVIGLPWCLWSLYSLSRRNVRLEEDGTLIHPQGSWRAEDVVGIDMNNWMEKSTAILRHRDGPTLLLDDYKHRNMHLVVGAFASRFEPDLWTAEARQVKSASQDDSESDAAEVLQRGDGD
jgi:hypothetical protein